MLITDEEPATTTTARRVLIVPVRSTAGAEVVRLCRDPLGARVVVAFTSVARLRAVLGVEQEWIRLGAGAVRSLADEAGVERLLIDPAFSAPPVRHEEPTPDPIEPAAPAPTPAPAPAPAAAPPAVATAGLAPSRAVSASRPHLGLATNTASDSGTYWDPQLLGVLRITSVVAVLLVVLSFVD
ncbi:SAV_915 family protein [Embleya sp. AB8]|uniref:SAV_915 family protein n=1 Tax=Embleya sp. AB8 TaxID=3156304 RepID=UPI003C7701A9